MTAQEDVKKFGFVNQPIDSNIDLKSEILRMKKEKNAVILGVPVNLFLLING